MVPESEVPHVGELCFLSAACNQVSVEESDSFLSTASLVMGIDMRGTTLLGAARSNVEAAIDPLVHHSVVDYAENARVALGIAKEAVAFPRSESDLSTQLCDGTRQYSAVLTSAAPMMKSSAAAAAAAAHCRGQLLEIPT